MRNKKKNRIYFLLILLLGISIGFAALATTLKINGTANIGKNTWDVHWANVGDVQKSNTTTITTGATVDSNDNTKVNFEVTLNQPGDYYEFQVDAVNAGTLDAMTNIVSQTTVPSYASLTVKYADGEEINKYDLLEKAPDPTADPPVYTTERVKVRIEFSKDIDPEDLEEIGDNESIDIAITVPYDQADDNAKDRHGLKLGDYFTLVPDASSATTNYAGFSGSVPTSDQTLWRVINIKDNGQIEAVSEYVSTGTITVSGTNGYKNYIAGMQDIASNYSKSGYTVETRMMGYNGQTLVISNTSAFDGSSNEKPWGTFLTGVSPLTDLKEHEDLGTEEELDGGVLGDNLYLRDYLLVSDVYKTGEGPSNGWNSTGLGATNKAGEETSYWLASRKYYQSTSYNSPTYFDFRCRYMYISGYINEYFVRSYYEPRGWQDDPQNYAVRPIITIKKGLTIASGTGVKTDPYIFD